MPTHVNRNIPVVDEMHTNIACSRKEHSLLLAIVYLYAYCWPTTGMVEQLGCVWKFRIQKLANIYRLVHSLVAIVQSWYLQSTQVLLITLVCQ